MFSLPHLSIDSLFCVLREIFRVVIKGVFGNNGFQVSKVSIYKLGLEVWFSGTTTHKENLS